MQTRDDVIKTLKPYIINHPHVLAVWEGGSAATNHLDAYSDLDVMLVVKKEDTETVFQGIETLFREHFGLEEAYRLKEPTWHGFSQTFYALKNSAPWFYVDLCILPPNAKDPFTAPDRHGQGVVWKDTIGFINPKPTEASITKKRVQTAYERATEGTFVLRKEIDKALIRNHYMDAYHFMYSFMMRSLVPLMNIEHRPTKVDFGLRYAKNDYTSDDYILIEAFMRAHDIEDLRTLKDKFINRYKALKKAYQ